MSSKFKLITAIFLGTFSLSLASDLTNTLRITSPLTNTQVRFTSADFDKVIQRIKVASDPRSDIPPDRDVEIINRLTQILQSDADQELRLTANLWLAVLEFDSLQGGTLPGRKEKLLLHRQKLDTLLQTEPTSWRTRVVELIRADSFLLTGEWKPAEEAIDSLLGKIDRYTKNPDPKMLEFFQIRGATLDESFEFDLLLLKAQAFARDNDFKNAIAVAQIARAKFPSLAKQRYLEDHIQDLVSGKIPWQVTVVQ